MKKGTVFSTFLTVGITCVIVLIARIGLGEIARSNEQRQLQTIFPYLLPGSTTFTEEAYTGEEDIIRQVYKGDTGFIICTAADGYAGEIELLVGVNNEGRVMGLTVRDLEETPGLGANVRTDAEFLVQYLGTAGEAETGTTVDAITGATVSSKAVTKGVNAAVAYVTGADISSGATEWTG